jgi:hypothetical protein
MTVAATGATVLGNLPGIVFYLASESLEEVS